MDLAEDHVPPFVTSDENPSTRDYWATFSADGESIIFSRTKRRGSGWELFVVATDGGEARPFLDKPIPVSATRATVSRAGRVAFTGNTRDGQRQLWIAESDGSNPTRIEMPGLSQRVVYPSWYADGERMVVTDTSNAPRLLLQIVDLKARKVSSITDPVQFLTGMGSVSPDGKHVAFAGQRNRGERYDQTKNTVCIVTEGKTRTVEKVPKMGRTPTWSPNGRWITFESNRGSPDGRSYAVFAMDKDGENLKRLTPYSWRANHPVWSPDGKKIVFSASHPERRNVAGIAVIEIDQTKLGESGPQD